MTEQSPDDQFEEIKPLAEALFDMSAMLVSKNGNFLPHGGTLSVTGDVAFVGAAPGEDDLTNSEEVLPLLHDSLRAETTKFTTRAVAVSESVFIGPDQTPAIKVLVEHRGGLTLAMYQTYAKRMLRGLKLGDVQMTEAAPEVGGWA